MGFGTDVGADLSPLSESNRRPFPYHGNALPTELRGPSRSSACAVECVGETTRPTLTRRNRLLPPHLPPRRCRRGSTDEAVGAGRDRALPPADRSVTGPRQGRHSRSRDEQMHPPDPDHPAHSPPARRGETSRARRLRRAVGAIPLPALPHGNATADRGRPAAPVDGAARDPGGVGRGGGRRDRRDRPLAPARRRTGLGRGRGRRRGRPPRPRDRSRTRRRHPAVGSCRRYRGAGHGGPPRECRGAALARGRRARGDGLLGQRLRADR